MKAARNYIDFDAFLAEQAEEPLIVKIGGNELILPPHVPAIVPIKLMALQRQYGPDGDVPQEEQVELALSLLGKEQLDAVLGTSLSVDDLGQLLQRLVAFYTGVEMGEDESPNALRPPKAAALTSSKTGRSSKRTSKGNTKSI